MLKRPGKPPGPGCTADSVLAAWAAAWDAVLASIEFQRAPSRGRVIANDKVSGCGQPCRSGLVMKSWELRHVICHEVKFPALSSMGLGTVLGAYFRAEGKRAIILFLDYNQQSRMQVAAKWSYLKQEKRKEKKTSIPKEQ